MGEWWTDSEETHEDRGLKNRPAEDARRVTNPPQRAWTASPQGGDGAWESSVEQVCHIFLLTFLGWDLGK